MIELDDLKLMLDCGVGASVGVMKLDLQSGGFVEECRIKYAYAMGCYDDSVDHVFVATNDEYLDMRLSVNFERDTEWYINSKLNRFNKDLKECL